MYINLVLEPDMTEEECVVENTPLVVNMVNKYIHLNDTERTSIKDDLIQEGKLGLIKAYRTYDPNRDVRFSTYAWYCIRNQLYKFMKKHNKYKNLIDEYIQSEAKIENTSCEPKRESSVLVENLTNREETFVDLKIKKYDNKEIKRIMSISESQLIHLINNIRRKLDDK